MLSHFHPYGLKKLLRYRCKNGSIILMEPPIEPTDAKILSFPYPSPPKSKCKVSHGNFRDRPHLFYIYNQESKFCDCIKIYIFHFGCFWGTYPKCILLMLTYFADNGFWNSCNPNHSNLVTHFIPLFLKWVTRLE